MADALTDFLAAAPWYQAIPAESRALVRSHALLKQVAAGDCLARAGEPSTHWYGVLEGVLQMYVMGPGGEETTLFCLQQGEWGGDGSLLKGELMQYDLRALVAARVCLIPKPAFDQLRRESLAFNQCLCDIMNRRMGAFVMVVISAAVAFLLWYAFSRGAHEIQPLIPALQSYWMKVHVPTNFVGYGAFALAAMVGVAHLLVERGILASRLPAPRVLEDVMYKAIAIGFAFFTIATILGALWAAEAWGTYWQWDPKETWALIVWLNYAAWLHMRLMKGLRGQPSAWWALVGLLVTTFAFLGVNMFLTGLHSYGEL